MILPTHFIITGSQHYFAEFWNTYKRPKGQLGPTNGLNFISLNHAENDAMKTTLHNRGMLHPVQTSVYKQLLKHG